MSATPASATDSSKASATPLPVSLRLFALFHVGLEEEIAQALKASHLHSIVFSDSAFVAFEHPADGLYFCQQMMRKMIRGGVPVRMGVAHGSFKPLRFKTDLAPDITLHSSYFLGSGVVKAHEAESSGVAGMRILLHRDFPLPAGFEAGEVISLPVAANLLDRQFSAERPNQRRVGDTTEFKIGDGGKLYLAAFSESVSRFIVSWAIQ